MGLNKSLLVDNTQGYSHILWPARMAQEAGFGREQMEEEVLTEDEEIRDLGH